MAHPIHRRSLVAIGVIVIAATGFPLAVGAEGLENFAVRAEASAINADYSPLDTYVDAFGGSGGSRLKFNFAASRKEGSDYLRRYAVFLSRVSPATLAGDDQLAFWLNLRNVLVLAHLSEQGGRADMAADRGAGPRPGPAWTAKVVTVDGVPLSIDDIERGIILANWKDPRVLYGLYQGSAGGPTMERNAFRGSSVHAALETAAKRYLQSSAGFQVTKKATEISAIFDWYFADLFGGDEAALRAHLNDFISERALIMFEKSPAIIYKKFSYKPDNLVPRTAQQRIESGQPTYGTGS